MGDTDLIQRYMVTIHQGALFALAVLPPGARGCPEWSQCTRMDSTSFHRTVLSSNTHMGVAEKEPKGPHDAT